MIMLRANMDIHREPAPPIVVGVDVGQRVDPTTIVVVEAFPKRRPSGTVEYAFETRLMERLPLGTPYPDVSKRITTVVEKLVARPVSPNETPPRITIILDITGVGRALGDILRADLADAGLRHVRFSEATFTFGDKITGGFGQSEIRVGKAGLVSRLQSIFQSERVRIAANHPEAAAMARELQDYEIKVDPEGDAKFGAFKVGSHDDLVTALGLAVLFEPRSRRGFWIA